MAKVIVQVVERCHALGVVHRDLKPENFLLSSRDPDAQLMATDFGLSAFYKGEVGGGGGGGSDGRELSRHLVLA